jgi:hypothetical protein
MQRPIAATRCLSYDDAAAALPDIRQNLKYRGLTRDQYGLCAEVGRYGQGWAVFVGFQPSTDADEAIQALGTDYPNPTDRALNWGFSALTHSI